jgi:K+-transporting ATPase ATPase A chain
VESTLSGTHPFWAFGLPVAAFVPIGLWMARALDLSADRVGRGLDALPRILGRRLGLREPASMDWKRSVIALLAFNAALFVLSFGLLYAQQYLPLNPDGKGSLGTLGYQDAAGVDHPGTDTGVVFHTVGSPGGPTTPVDRSSHQTPLFPQEIIR